MRLESTLTGAALALLIELVSSSAAAGERVNTSSSETQFDQRAPKKQLDRPKQPNRMQRELLFLDAGVGAMYVDMLALKGSELLDPARLKSSGFGLMCSTALGLRLREFTIAVRYRYGDFSDWQLWTLGGEASMNVSLGRIEPYVGFGAAYAALSGIHADVSGVFGPYQPEPVVDIHGLNLQVHLGLRYYVSSWFSLGANISGDAFFLHRMGDHLNRLAKTDPNAPPTFPYGVDGSGNGLGIAPSLVLGLHY